MILPVLFSLSLFVSAGLLFSIQPLVAKTFLPVYGGTPAVWLICSLFFQTLLLLGYGYAWWLNRLRSNFTWKIFHSVLLLVALISLPTALNPNYEEGFIQGHILLYLFKTLGIPLSVIAASAPLLQFAYYRIQSQRSRDPYFLYAASNFGSFLSLLLYPFFIERYIGLHSQFNGWIFLFSIYVILMNLLIWGFSYSETDKLKRDFESPLITQVLTWIGLSFLPASLLVGVTFYITTDIAPTPLFFVLPLLLYLLSFVITFSKKPLISHEWVSKNSLFFMIFPIIGFIFGPNKLHATELILFNLSNFFMLCLLCHGNLMAKRPPASQLTLFYLCLAFGGVLAGIFNGLIAPFLFSNAYEYPLILALVTVCFSLSKEKKLGWTLPAVFLLLLLDFFFFSKNNSNYSVMTEIAALILIVTWPKNNLTLFLSISLLFAVLFFPSLKNKHVLTQKRNFYGIKQVISMPHANILLSQNILHGFQRRGIKTVSNGKMAYYSPVFPVIHQLHRLEPFLNSFIIGLGTGMLTCQFQSEDRVKIIDIDNQVIEIAQNSDWFDFIKGCPPKVEIAQSDGRLAIQNEKDGRLDLLIMDAFTSDAIPVHLLTLEAFKVYQQKLKESGVLLVNISNRHVNLLPIITTIGQNLDLIVLQKKDEGNIRLFQLPSEWVLLTKNEKLAFQLMGQHGWQFMTTNPNKIWTDDYSNLLSVLKW